MSDIHPSFGQPLPARWTPQVGERVRLLFRGKSYIGEVTQILDEPAGYVVSSDDLLMPVVCGRSSLRPIYD